MHVACLGGGEFILPQTAQQQKAVHAGRVIDHQLITFEIWAVLVYSSLASQDFWEMADKNGLELDTSYHGHSARILDWFWQPA